jgi:uncharacterized membrane protein YfcA
MACAMHSTRAWRRIESLVAFVTVATVSFLASCLTLYSGFGLGTLLLPAFALFFPLEVAVAATAVVHGANNVFKIAAVGRKADVSVVLRFGIPAILAAIAGAALLGFVAHLAPIASWHLGPCEAVVTPVKLTIAVLMAVFALFELLPRLRHLQFDRKYLVIGGLLSGFFGGISGHQGALRAAFLIKLGLSPGAYVGTNAVIGFLVDAVRILTYFAAFAIATDGAGLTSAEIPIIATGILAALAGVIVGMRYLQKMTLHSIQTITGSLLLVIAVTLGIGLI